MISDTNILIFITDFEIKCYKIINNSSTLIKILFKLKFTIWCDSEKLKSAAWHLRLLSLNICYGIIINQIAHSNE
jgi:hypothetical protein